MNAAKKISVAFLSVLLALVAMCVFITFSSTKALAEEQSSTTTMFPHKLADSTIGISSMSGAIQPLATGPWAIGKDNASDLIATRTGDTLTITGHGDAKVFTTASATSSSTSPPWYIGSSNNWPDRLQIYHVVFDTDDEAITCLDYWFADCTELLDVTGMPSTVTSMAYTFRGCAALTEAPELPPSVENLKYCFQACEGFTEAPFVPETVTNMSYTFYQCKNLTYLPDGWRFPEGAETDKNTFKPATSNSTRADITCAAADYAALTATYDWDAANRDLYARSLDTTALEAALDDVKTLDEDNYTPETWATLADAVARAEYMLEHLDDDPPYQADIDALTAEIYDDIDALINVHHENNWEIGSPDAASVKATLWDDGTLAITGTGDTITFASADQVPWYTERSKIQSITFEDGVTPTSLDWWACGCTNLNEPPILPNTITSMIHTFEGCTSLVKPSTIPDAVTNMSYAFADCTSLEVAALVPAGVEDMSYAFSGCTALTLLPDRFAFPNKASVEGAFYVGDPYTADNPLQTTCAQIDYETLLAYNWADDNRKLVPKGADISALQAAIERAEALTKSDWSNTSWGVMQKALKSAEEIVAQSEANKHPYQSDVDAATNALNNAIDELVLVREITADMFTVDTSTVVWDDTHPTKSISGADGDKVLVEDTDYTVDYENNDQPGTATIIITGIDAYKGELSYTFKITFNEPDKSALEAVIDEAKSLDEADWWKSTWESMQEALSEAICWYDYEWAVQREVDAAVEALRKAIDGLVSIHITNYWEIGLEDRSALVATLWDDGAMVFTGSGDAYDLAKTPGGSSSTAIPWYSERSQIKSVRFETDDESITSLYMWFYSCTQLTDVGELPSSVESLYYAFYNCDSLIDLPAIPDGVQNMSGTFGGCDGFEHLPQGYTIPDSVTTMRYMFSECKNLTSLCYGFVIPDGVTDVSGMFTNCPALSELPAGFTVPASVSNMRWMFYDCTSLTTLPERFSFPTTANTENAFYIEGYTVWGTGITTYCSEADYDALNSAYSWLMSYRLLTAVPVDADELRALVDEASVLVETDYTEGSWTVLTDALIAAEELFAGIEEKTVYQSEADAMTASFTEALDGLVALPADKTDLEAAMAEADALSESDFTASSWEALQKVLEAAEEVDVDEAALRSVTDNACAALRKALDALVYIADLREVINEAALLNEGDYTVSSWAALQEVLGSAEGVLADGDATQTVVNEAVGALQEAIAELIDAADKTALEEVIAETDGLSESDYTSGSWAALEEVLGTARAVDADGDASQEEVNETTGALHEALDALVYIANLREVINEAVLLNESDYTPESWTVFQDALTAAQVVDENGNATQEEVDDAVQALQEAIKNLEKAPEPEPTPEPSPIEIEPDMFVVDTTYAIYDGSTPITKTITSNLTLNTDYTVTYANNNKVGDATITITGIGDYEGTLTYTFKIIHYFEDVGATITGDNNWYFDAVYGMVDLGAITGYTETRFGVGDSMTRAQLVTIMWRYCEPDQYKNYDEPNSKNTTDLPDNPNGTYYTQAVNWAVSQGVVTGNLHADGTYTFNPDDSITFEQMITIVARYVLGQTEAATWNTTALNTGVFTDAASVSDYARGPMSWAIEKEIVTGNNNGDGTFTLAPLSSVARERATTVLYRSINDGLL